MVNGSTIVRTAVLCALALLGGLAPETTAAELVVVETQAVPLNPIDRNARTVGRLRYRGGLHLRSRDPRFGGFSALGVSPRGDRMVAISDRGARFSARLVHDEDGNLAAIRDADLGQLAGPDGLPLTDRDDSDVEAMGPGVRGEMIVAFETRHRLLLYMPDQVRPEPLPAPPELASLPPNNGIEGLTLLDDGRLLALTPGVRGRGAAIGWVSSADGWSVLTYPVDDAYPLTGAATLPGGDVAVIERFFSPRGENIVRVNRIAADAIRPGAVLRPELLAELRTPITVDNFEGIEARRGAKGETLIYLISDDNFDESQRTLLLMFELIE